MTNPRACSSSSSSQRAGGGADLLPSPAAPIPCQPSNAGSSPVGPTAAGDSDSAGLPHGLARFNVGGPKTLSEIDTFREYIDYNPDTGEFIWKKRASQRAIIGRKAGCLNNQGYLAIMLKGKTMQAHRIAFALMTGKWPDYQIDHINGDRSDNRWANLREANWLINSKNRKTPITNTSGVMGLQWNRKINKWMAKITNKGKQYHLGCFENKQDAIKARKDAERRFGFHENHGNR